MLGGGGIGEHEASAVTGGGGMEEQATAVSGGGSAAEGLLGHCPGGKNHRPRTPGPFRSAPRPRTARLSALCRPGSPAQSIPVRSAARPGDGPAVQPGGIAGHLARAAGEVIAGLVR